MAESNYVGYDELVAIQSLIDALNENFQLVQGSDIDVAAEVSDANGDVLGTVLIKQSDGYVFVPRGWSADGNA